jgi:hypothetical protein
MTANQRRPGFRLPWSPESEEAGGEENVATVAPDASSQPAMPGVEADERPETDAAAAVAAEGTPTSAETDHPPGEGPVAASGPTGGPASTPGAGDQELMRNLVAAMRGVADEARDAGVSELRSRADEQVRRLESDAQRRQEELRQRAEADVAGIGEWATAETERIRTEAEQRTVARRTQLDQQLAADSTRTDGETRAVRDRVAEYERELEAYHAQLTDISDPAAFAAAAKRMPTPPGLTGAGPAAAAPVASDVHEEAPEAEGSPTAEAAQSAEAAPAAEAAPEAEAATAAGLAADLDTSPTQEGGAPEMAPPASDEPAAAAPPPDEALAGRLAALDAASASGNGASAAPAGSGEPVTTEVIVKGLGSFGAITGFRQSLSSVDGVDGVALSLGQTGEFVFRATHAAGFDLRGAIVALEGDGAKVEDRPEGGLRVTLERAR